MAEETKEEESAENWLTSEIEEVGPCKKHIKVAVASARVKEELEEAYQELKRNVMVPGFRKGRAPVKLLERRFGKEMTDQVKESLGSEAFQKVLEDENLTLVGEPQFDEIKMEEDDALSFEVDVEVRPEFELGDYKKLKLSKPSEEVEDSDVDSAIEGLRLQRSELVTEDGKKAAEGDVVLGQWRIVAGENVLSEEKEVLIPVQKGRVHGVEVDLPKVLKNAASGDEKKTKIKLPADFENSEFAGQKAEIRIEVKEIKTRRLPELDEEFAKVLGLDSLEALREEVKKQVAARKKMASREGLESQVFESLLSGADFEVPEGLLEREQKRLRDDMRRRLRFRGVPPKVVEERLEEMGDQARDESVKRIKAGFILDNIAETEKIVATEDEVQRLIEALASDSGQKADAVKKRMEESGAIYNLRAQIRREKAVEWILDKAEITEEKKK
jgi:trigger factor